MEDQSFKLCITMAGAVSAGAYTAGVLDYLLETLDLWEKAKARNRKLGKDHPDYDHSVPMHKVEIDVMSGSSAGGICGSLAMMALTDKNFKSFGEDNSGKNNLFYQGWVEMGQTPGRTTLDSLLDNGDLKKSNQVESLLNTNLIDEIADTAIKIRENKPVPAYASDSLDLILTTTNLRGINFRINFEGSGEDSSGGSVITNHGGFLRYKVKNEKFQEGIPKDENELYFVLDIGKESHLRSLKKATLSTAAFPIGLKSRELAISKAYIERYPKYLFGQAKGIKPEIKSDKFYRFNSVDGGVINNEPYGIGLKILREKNPEHIRKNKYAVIMIDPFPNKDDDTDVIKSDIGSIASGLIRSLRNQVMFNQEGILDAIVMAERTKFMIEPIRKEYKNGTWDRSKNDLASAPLAGFAGFINKDFREHDFHLGRKNCQDFLRYYFAIENKDVEVRLDLLPTTQMLNRFEFSVPPKDPNGKKYFPIIPDMRVIKNRDGIFDKNNYGKEADLKGIPYPKMSFKVFENSYKSKIKDRIGMIVKKTMNKKFLSFLVNFFYAKGAGYRMIAETIEKELRESELID